MPRGRGGGGQRTDLPGKVPIMSAPDQEYGKRTAQEQSQRMLPIATPGLPTVASGPPAPAGGPPPGIPSLPLPAAGPTGADQGGLGAPPLQPAPATQGLPTGPGAGPEVAGPLMRQHLALQASEQGTLQQLLSHLSSQPGASSAIKTLAASAGVHGS